MVETKLPKKIEHCPIVEAVIELRFDATLPLDAIFGVIYKEFEKDFSSPPKSLPLLQLPEVVRSGDPNLIFKPLYQLIDGKFIFQIGPKVVSLATKDDYIGWETFSKRIKDYFARIKKLNIIAKPHRLGIRYINFFKDIDIFDQIKLNVCLGDELLDSKNLFIKAAIEADDFLNIVQISNESVLTAKGESKKGSIVDIDTYYEKPDILDKIDSLIEEGHVEEKRLFFSLLEEDFLKSLKPVY